MSAYRFCRTDDIPLLVDALRRCWLPHFPAAPEPTVEAFKREIRELQVWCSSCMVAFAGDQPVGVLIGAKRARETLVQRIAVHPEHLRRGHARHLLTSLSSKLAILGPPRLVAEVPAESAEVRGLFESAGYAAEASLTDWLLAAEGRPAGGSGPPPDDSFLVPIPLEDVRANDLLAGAPEPAWERAIETLTAREETLRGLAMATTDRIAAVLLHRPVPDGATEIVTLRALDDDPEEQESFLGALVGAFARRHRGPIRFPRALPEEVPQAWLESWGFRAERTCERYVATARPA